MKKIAEPFEGCVLLESPIYSDARGYFRRLFTAQAGLAVGLPEGFRQNAASFNAKKGTVRGLHYQAAPYLEHKLVQCVRGAIFDVMVDLRPESGSYGQWYGAELSEENGRVLYSAPGFAHGFQALSDDCLVLYHISPDYQDGLAGGVRWNDPDIAITWPLPAVELSDKDQVLPLLRDHDHARTSALPGRPA